MLDIRHLIHAAHRLLDKAKRALSREAIPVRRRRVRDSDEANVSTDKLLRVHVSVVQARCPVYVVAKFPPRHGIQRLDGEKFFETGEAGVDLRLLRGE